MAADESVPLLAFAFEREDDDRIFARWLPLQDVISFDDFKASLTQKRVLKSNREIMADVNKIIAASVKENNGNI